VRPQSAVDRLDGDELVSPIELGVDITEEQQKVIMKSLSVKAKDRYQSAEDFRNEMLRTLVDKPKPKAKPVLQKRVQNDKERVGKLRDIRVKKLLPVLIAEVAFVILASIGIHIFIGRQNGMGFWDKKTVAVESKSEEDMTIVTPDPAVTITIARPEPAVTMILVTPEPAVTSTVVTSDPADTSNPEEDYEIEWKDENLEEALRYETGIWNRPILYSDVKEITNLSLVNKQISDISALSEFSNLTSLDLSLNKISDISALSGLSNLTSLRLSYNSISDISALSGLSNLESLHLSNNPIDDYSPVENLNLTYTDF